MRYLFLLLMIIAVKANAQKLLRTDSVYISGKIKNFDAVKYRDNSVSIIINELALGKPITYKAMINNDGSYRLSFLKTGTQDAKMWISDKLIPLLISPGDHLVINFDALQFENSLVFTGDDAQTNRDYRAYQLALNMDSGLSYNGQTRYKNMTASEKSNWPDAHKKFLKDRYDKENVFLNQYLETHKVTPIFARWAKADLKYEYLNNLMRYPWLHRQYNADAGQFSVSDGYYGFVIDAELNDPGATITSNYGAYVFEYYKRFNEKNLGASYNVSTGVDICLKEPSGIKRDLMLSRFIYQLIDDGYVEKVKPVIDKYKAGVSQPAIKNSIVKIYDAKIYQLANYILPQNARINARPQTDADNVFNKIIAKYPGKIVYVDFWATWCVPCRAEMPNSNVLHKQLAGKDVVFVYLAVQSEEKVWKASIAEMGLEGEHFLLENNDFKSLRTKFYFSGIPHYILVDKKAHVYDIDAKRPNEGVKADIDKLLAAK